jgi:hypothetical protein
MRLSMLLLIGYLFFSCAHHKEKDAIFTVSDRREISASATEFLAQMKNENNILEQTQMAENYFELKKYYFHTLYGQLNLLTSWLGHSEKTLSSCPMFHDQFISTLAKFHRSEMILTEKERRITEDRVEHLTAELKEFCSSGSSSDFYKFHNLMLTIYQNNYKTEAYISGIEKMQVFQNHYFISKRDSQFSRRDVASENEVDQLFKAPFVWFTKVTR